MDTKEIKLMIIENFIDHYTSDETEREAMKEEAKKVKSLADQKQMNPADGLKMWLFENLNGIF